MAVFINPRNRPKPRQHERSGLVVTLLLGGWTAWLLLALFLALIAPAEGTGSRWPLTRAELGQFGDSFGVLSSLMASLAAVFTWSALQDERKRNDEASRRDHERAIEATFFRMLETRRQLVSEVTFKSQTGHLHTGADAFDAMRREIITRYLTIGAQASYDSVINRAGGSIQHYFRLSYHTVRRVHHNLEKEDAYEYIRIFRAETSAGEQFVIAMNAVFGKGRPNMLQLINEQHILHNLPDSERDWLGALPDTGLTESAFQSPSSRAGDPA